MSDELIPNAALILPPTGGDRYLATAKVARIPIIIRNLNAANKAGIEHFHILISSDRKREVLQLLQSENKFQGKIDWLDANDPVQQEEFCRTQRAPLFVFNANLLFDPRVLKKMAESFQAEREKEQLLVPDFASSRLSESARTLLVLISPTQLPSLVSRLAEGNDWSCLDEAVTGLDQKDVDIPHHWLFKEINRENLAHAADALLSHLGKPNDNLVIHYIRKISALIAKPLAYTPVRPNHVTLFAFLLGMLAALSMFQASYGWVVFGAFLLVVAWIVDCADGMLARLKLEETRLGAWLDLVLDNFVHVAIFIAITNVVYTQSHYKDLVLYGGGLLVFGACLSFAMVVLHTKLKKDQPRKGQNKTEEVIETVLEHMTHRDFCLWILLFALFNHLEIFFWAAVFGTNLFAGLFLYVNLKKGLLPEAGWFKMNKWQEEKTWNKRRLIKKRKEHVA